MTRFTIFLILTSLFCTQCVFARKNILLRNKSALRGNLGSLNVPMSQSALIVDGDTGAVLHSVNADEQRHPASLTKKMTLYLLFDALKKNKISLNTTFPVSSHAARQIPSKLGIPPGNTVTVEVLIKALVIKSANDMALVVAEGLAGTLPNFVTKMNEKAKELGMTHTRFTNASGVPDRGKNVHRISTGKQVTTARDMIKLSMALHKNFPEYWKYFQLRSFTFKGNTYHTHNHFMKSFAGAEGGKTGFVNASGFNLSTSAIRYKINGKPVRLFGVYMGGSTRHERDRRLASLMEVQFKRLGATVSYQTKIRES